jgi:hypothetical protein
MDTLQRYPRLVRAIAAQIPDLAHAAEVRIRLAESGVEVELRSETGHAQRIVFTETFRDIFDESLGFGVARDLMALDASLQSTAAKPAEP